MLNWISIYTQNLSIIKLLPILKHKVWLRGCLNSENNVVGKEVLKASNLINHARNEVPCEDTCAINYATALRCSVLSAA